MSRLPGLLRFRRHVASVVVLSLLLAGTAFAVSRPSAKKPTTYYACVTQEFHTLNLTTKNARCPSGERKISFNAQGKRQTAFAVFSAVPFVEDDETDVEIDEKDLRIDRFRSSGAGGQHVNVTDSAIRITHLPTGIVVSCQNERSQHQNKDRAMQILRAKLAEVERQKRAAEMAEVTGETSAADFGTQIRSYVLHPYQMVKDLRSEHETGNVESPSLTTTCSSGTPIVSAAVWAMMV